MTSTHPFVFSFATGDGKNKQLLGGKGANLCEMTQMGLNVPPGFVISTAACLEYLSTTPPTLPDGLMDEVKRHIQQLETATGKGFGQREKPLLVSVRSGSALSMPGMMDTILNLGLNQATLAGEIQLTGDARFGYDIYRRFIQLFGKVALGIADEQFDAPFHQVKTEHGIKEDTHLTADHLKTISERFLEVVQQQTGQPFPEDPYMQLELAIKAVFNSWLGKRAVDYRREFHITPDQANGTAVNIVAMVFGNRGNDSATGVGFTRNPGTGENVLFGEYLVNAQGEDVVAGIRTPKPIQQLAQEMPALYQQLETLRNNLEQHYREVQDFEFTIEKGVLYCLQTRNGKMNAPAMVRTSVEMHQAGLITREQALLRINPQHLEQMLYPRLDPKALATPIAQGLPASPGAASGKAIFDANRAESAGKQGQAVILVREETKPEDIHGFFAAQGILTSRGGKTSHAAVVARGMGKPCVAGAEGIQVDVQARQARIGDVIIREGDVITLDGTTGKVYLGDIARIEAEFTPELQTLLSWADQAARIQVMANADSASDAKRALQYGAKGIGLCRTERMFNAVERLPVMVAMIMANTLEERQAALSQLLPMQRSDFRTIFEVMAPYPVTIRLLDPPIHEFLPGAEQLQNELEQLAHLHQTATGLNIFHQLKTTLPTHPVNVATLPDPQHIEQVMAHKQALLAKVRALHEVNPMLGHRGVRLGMTFPEIYQMQIRAILEAAADCQERGLDIRPEIMVPQVATVQELKQVRQWVSAIQQEIEQSRGLTLSFQFGTMMEVVRACMRADSLAQEADFFSFGTNDLTQATFSFSREDAENKFLPFYNEHKLLQDNPFEVLDTQGVGKLMELALNWGRAIKPDLKIGICGEQGGHPQSIAFCHQLGLSYVSCSAPRVPIARLAAAHAQLKRPH